MSREIDEHRRYLSDAPRVTAFRRALAEVVRPGDAVVDLGAGTGVLGLLACEAGAARVYAIDAGPILGVARQIAFANGWGDRIVHIREVSTRAVLPEPVDLIVTDQIGHFGMEAGLLTFLRDGSRRWLKPGGVTVPTGLALWIAPVEHDSLRAGIEFWNSNPSGLDVSSVSSAASNSGYPHQIEPACLLGAGRLVISLDLTPTGPDTFRGEIDLEIERDGQLDGLAGWFSARLSPSVTMTNAPGHPDQIRRRQVFFPVARRTPVSAGDRLHVSMMMRPSDLIVNWTVTVADRRGQPIGGAFRHSTLDGMLLSRDDLRRTEPRFVPRLTPAGVARRSVLELCDGTRPIAEIEREMLARHADLLPDPAAASAFVAEVLAVYAR